jgi:rhamnosyltransferase subunit B
MRRLTCIATSFGSAGDFLPTLAIAAALRRRGHDVRFVANPSYESQVRLAAGAPPVVVGLGSAFSRVAGDLLRDVATACADLDRRCLVVGHPGGVAFPSNTLAVRWAPHERVFSRAAAVVVHGGAGTTAEALRAGRPIVGVPFAYDQFTLCEYVERLGIGRRVRVKRRSRADLMAMLREVLSNAAMAQRATEAGARFAAEPDGAETAAEVIERRIG